MRRPRTFLNTILGVVIAAGCANQPAGPSESTLSESIGLADLAIASCPSPAKATTSATIGWAGGTLNIGPHRLVVPAGALSRTVTITATTGYKAGNAIQFGPAGLRFNMPVQLIMSTANCSGLGWLHLPVIVYTDDYLKILEVPPSVPRLSSSTVVGWIQHFSQYAVAF